MQLSRLVQAATCGVRQGVLRSYGRPLSSLSSSSSWSLAFKSSSSSFTSLRSSSVASYSVRHSSTTAAPTTATAAPTTATTATPITTTNESKNDNNNKNNNQNTNETKGRKQVGWWLVGCGALVVGMVVVGGVTRLTESGLSITEWKPIVGALPPTSRAEWEIEFDKYKQFPEYKKLNIGMTLEEFKFIYAMEYSHRLLGRVVGVVFFFPYVYFIGRGYIRGKEALKLGSIFALGGLQGALGWYMVKSGLDEHLIQDGVPRVSQYRLAAHMGSAVLIYGGLLWSSLNYLRSKSLANNNAIKSISTIRTLRPLAFGCMALSFITIISGAFVAGLDAGLIYNTFPLMGEQWVPENVWDSKYDPALRNITENDVTVQFQHRILGITTYTAVTLVYLLSFRARKNLPKSTRIALHAMFAAATTQVILGITTLLTFVPVPLAAAHQSGAVTLFSIAIWLLHELRRLPK